MPVRLWQSLLVFVERDNLEIGDAFDGFIRLIKSPRYCHIILVINFKGICLFVYIKRYTQPASYSKVHTMPRINRGGACQGAHYSSVGFFLLAVLFFAHVVSFFSPVAGFPYSMVLAF
jgi:hypothetical protein